MFIVNGVPQMYYGTIATVSADNLAQCSIGGFKEGSTAYRGCRQCMAKRHDFQTVVCNQCTIVSVRCRWEFRS